MDGLCLLLRNYYEMRRVTDDSIKLYHYSVIRYIVKSVAASDTKSGAFLIQGRDKKENQPDSVDCARKTAV